MLPKIKVIWKAVGRHRDCPGAASLGSTPASICRELRDLGCHTSSLWHGFLVCNVDNDFICLRVAVGKKRNKNHVTLLAHSWVLARDPHILITRQGKEVEAALL